MPEWYIENHKNRPPSELIIYRSNSESLHKLFYLNSHITLQHNKC
uniref:Uncharacterized protein n=1 Tax=Heterorhabditis bacteriophora TaxID=37862 RepID=A0A1I7WA99_HETBA